MVGSDKAGTEFLESDGESATQRSFVLRSDLRKQQA